MPSRMTRAISKDKKFPEKTEKYLPLPQQLIAITDYTHVVHVEHATHTADRRSKNCRCQ
jgi:hypothetical protein